MRRALALVVLLLALPLRAQDAGRPPLTVETLEFLPGQGRAARSYLLYTLPDTPSGEAYLDHWDAVQILQANRYFDPVTRKVSLGFGGHRVKLTDGSAWTFFDGRPRQLGAPCRIVAGRCYLPLSFWPVLLEEFGDLPLRADPDALRLVGGLRSVNVLSVDWAYSGERLRGVFQLSEPLAPSLERAGETALRLRFPDGRLAPFDWERLPGRAPVDSLRIVEDGGGVSLLLYFRRPVSELRSAFDATALTWAMSADSPETPGLVTPEFAGELPERLPDGAAPGRALRNIVLDPGHGGADNGAVSGSQTEKDWTLRVAHWLEPYLLREGFTLLWTRRDDSARPASARVQAANVGKGDLYLSLHFTRRGVSGEPGLEIVLQETQTALAGPGALQPWSAVQGVHAERSLELAAGIQHSLGVLTEWPQLGIRRESTVILEGADMPALLLELGNLDSPAEREAWEDRRTRDRRLETLAKAIAYRARRWGGKP